jgi:glycosidase
VLLGELSEDTGRPVTLGTIPDSLLDEWEAYGFDAVWLMGVWKSGKLGQEIAKNVPGLQDEYRRVLADFGPADVIGSPYAVNAYHVSATLGGNRGLAALRRRLEKRGMGLILDFVGNHTARDHAWVTKFPEFYVNGAEGDDLRNPGHYFRTKTAKGERVLAFGRDPTFPGWTDTAQLNHLHRGLRDSLISTLKGIASQCDGVRCDMAMLSLRGVFEKTWGNIATPVIEAPAEGEFWKEAIEETRRTSPRFLFLAEAYWDLEWDLQQLGFDYTYDKRLYDRLLREGAGSVFDHLGADPDFQNKLIRFIENHDEPRAASALSSDAWHRAAATIMATVPGMVLFHEGQLQGRVVKVPVQLGRRPKETPSPVIQGFYRSLLDCLSSPVVRRGLWRRFQAKPAWNENHSWRNIIASSWDGDDHGQRLVVVNYAPHASQCYLQFPPGSLGEGTFEFRDLLGPAVYFREGSVLESKGMFFDLPPYAVHIFNILPSH